MYQKREKRKSVSKIESKLEVACAMEKNKTRTGDWEAVRDAGTNRGMLREGLFQKGGAAGHCEDFGHVENRLQGARTR